MKITVEVANLDEFKQYMGIESPSLLALATNEAADAPAPAPAEAVQEPQEAPEAPAPKKKTEKAAPAEAEPAAEPKPANPSKSPAKADKPSEAPKKASDEVKETDVRAAFAKLIKAGHRDEVKKILEGFGAANLPELQAEHYAAALAAAEEAMA